MAIPEYKNGHFEEMAAWSQIPQIVGNSTLIYLSFDTHDSPRAVFVMAFPVVEFSKEGYKIRKVFG